MQIEDVKTYPVSIPLVDLEDGGIAPYLTNHNELNVVDRVIVQVETDNGTTGWGEMRTFLNASVTMSIIEDGITPLVVGRSPFEVESLRRDLFIEYTNPDLFFAPIETACWDIVGKTLDKPVYELLGGWTAPTSETRRRDPDFSRTEAVDVAYCLGILPPEESREVAKRVYDQGYTVLKTKAGRDWHQDVARIEAMHDEVDGDLDFRLDPNQGWSLDEAVRVCAQLEDAGIYLEYVEQPIRIDSPMSLVRLRQRTNQPIGINEDTYVPHNLQQFATEGAIDVAVLDFTPLGGISGLRQAAGVAEEANIPIAHHCAFDLGIRTAAILHAVSGIPGFSLPIDTAYYAWEDDVLTDTLDIEDGAITVPSGPGLGVEVDGDKLSEYRTSSV